MLEDALDDDVFKALEECMRVSAVLGQLFMVATDGFTCFTCCTLLASENVRCEKQDAQEAPARAEEPKEAEAVAVPEDCLL